jgi:hypothetical protein
MGGRVIRLPANAPAHRIANRNGDDLQSFTLHDLRMKFPLMRWSRVEDFIHAMAFRSLSRCAIVIFDCACAMKLARLIASRATTSLFAIDVRSLMRAPLFLTYDLHRNCARLRSKSLL